MERTKEEEAGKENFTLTFSEIVRNELSEWAGHFAFFLRSSVVCAPLSEMPRWDTAIEGRRPPTPFRAGKWRDETVLLCPPTGGHQQNWPMNADDDSQKVLEVDAASDLSVCLRGSAHCPLPACQTPAAADGCLGKSGSLNGLFHRGREMDRSAPRDT